MNKRIFVCLAGLLVVFSTAQPTLAEDWKLYASTGNGGDAPCPECLGEIYGLHGFATGEGVTTASNHSLSAHQENLYELDLSNGQPTYIRGLRNNVDLELAQSGWIQPFWGENHRDGQSIAYNPNDGLLYHRNGRTGYRDSVTDPRSYDTRLIETYYPGPQAEFTADPVKVYNSLTDRPGGPVNDRIDPFHPFDGTIWGEARSFTWNPVDNYFILADNDGDIGYWDPTNGAATDTAVHVVTNAVTHRGISWYTTNLDGSGTQRLFSGVNDESPGNLFYELDSDSASGTYLEPLAMAATINLLGGPAGVPIDQTQGMAQNPETGDLYSVITLDQGGRHLIRYNQADIDAFNPFTDTSINAQYLGSTDLFVAIGITSITFVPITMPGDGNDDGWVDGVDYLIWAENFGTHPGTGTGPGNGDYNDDGWVDGLDYLTWAENFGTHSGSTAVPEPATGMLLLWGLAVYVGQSRRRAC